MVRPLPAVTDCGHSGSGRPGGLSDGVRRLVKRCGVDFPVRLGTNSGGFRGTTGKLFQIFRLRPM